MFTKKTFKCILAGFSLILLLIIAACGGSIQSKGNAEVQEPITLTATTYLPDKQLSWKNVVEPMAKEIEEVTEGRVSVNLYPNGALGSADQLYDMARTGVADLSVGNYGYTPGQFPLMGVHDLPFMAESAEQGSYVMWNLWKEYEKEFKKNHKGVKVAWLYKIDPYDIFTVDKKVTKPEDMKGLKIRTPSTMGSRFLELTGATPVQIPMGDVYQAMQTGVIDGALVPRSVLFEFSLSEVTDYVFEGKFLTQSFFAFMNTDTWEKISSEDQEAIWSLMGGKASLAGGKAFDEAWKLGNEAGKEAGVEFYNPSEEELAEWKEITEPMYGEWISEMEGQGYPAQEIFDRALELRDEYKEKE